MWSASARQTVMRLHNFLFQLIRTTYRVIIQSLPWPNMQTIWPFVSRHEDCFLKLNTTKSKEFEGKLSTVTDLCNTDRYLSMLIIRRRRKLTFQELPISCSYNIFPGLYIYARKIAYIQHIYFRNEDMKSNYNDFKPMKTFQTWNHPGLINIHQTK